MTYIIGVSACAQGSLRLHPGNSMLCKQPADWVRKDEERSTRKHATKQRHVLQLRT